MAQGFADVSEKVSVMIKNGSNSVEATNANFGDPASLHVKQLHVIYLLDGKRMEKIVGENQDLVLIPDGSDTARPDFELVSSPTHSSLIAFRSGKIDLTYAAGPGQSAKFEGIKAPAPLVMPLLTNWKLSFPPGLGAPPSIAMPKLISWPDSDVSGVKYFSGSAVYDKSFSVSAAILGSDRAVILDLGVVKNFAEVWINGKSMGTLWKPPFRIDVRSALNIGNNSLKIRVTNLWPNRIIGDEHLPSDVDWNGEVIRAWPQWMLDGKKRPPSPRITWTTWRVFTKDSPLYPSGLIGPVELISAAKMPLN